MDFVFMLTRDDRTVTDCLDVVEQLRDLGLTHIGFKDVGVDAAILRRLDERIKRLGATSYLEVVSTDPRQSLRSAQVAVEIGVDCLLGGTEIEPTLELIAGAPIRYLPFAGTPVGHPTQLNGTPEQIAVDCRRLQTLGCDGVDLLAHRATAADPLALVEAARAETAGTLLVAGAIDRLDQLAPLAARGVDAFTIGSAAFAARLDLRAGTLGAQITAVQTTLDSMGDMTHAR